MSMKQSYSGILRSVVYDIFRSYPALIKPVCDFRWDEALKGKDVKSMQWTDTELQQYVKALVTNDLEIEDQTVTPCFCIFIAGLDEYHGDQDLAKLFLRLADTGRAKVCASSRPWNKFEDAFAGSRQNGTYLELHHHNQSDIAKVVDGELGAKLSRINRTGEEWKSLIHEVIDRTKGVFLWVTLVLKTELIPCLENREDIDFLKKRLSTVPLGLDEYFQHIFDRIWADDKYRTETARLFKSCMVARLPLLMAAFRVMIHDYPDTLATTTAIEYSRNWDLEGEIEEARALVNGRCQDLLAVICPQDINDRNSNDPEYLSKSAQDRLEQYAGYAAFDAHFTLLACYVFLIRKAYKMIRVERFDLLCGPCHYLDDWASIVSNKAGRNWSNEAFFQMRNIAPGPSCASLLKALDDGMEAIYIQVHGFCHWSNHTVEDLSSYGFLSLFHNLDVTEHGERDLIGHMIQLGLTAHIETFLKTDPNVSERKDGRPYLDYALRYKTGADAEPKRPKRLESTCAMVKMLLEQKLNVNQKVEIHGGRTVWESYVYFIFDNNLGNEYHRKTTWLSIDHGAKHTHDRVLGVEHKQAPRSNSHDDIIEVGLERSIQNASFSAEWMLRKLFGEMEAREMQKFIMTNSGKQGWLNWLSEGLPLPIQIVHLTP